MDEDAPLGFYYTLITVVLAFFVWYQILHMNDKHCNVYTGKCTDGKEMVEDQNIEELGKK